MSKNTGLEDILCKRTLRTALLERRKQFAMEDCVRLSARIKQHLVQSALWQEAQSVGLYMAKGREVHTQELVEQAWQEGKQVYLPRCRPEQRGLMDFVLCQGRADLAEGAYGIQEPTLETFTRQQALGKGILGPDSGEQSSVILDILLVPGVGFDGAGQRMGFGGGYYDRFLHALQGQKTRCIGAAFSWQVLKALPRESWDMPVHALITEEALQWI